MQKKLVKSTSSKSLFEKAREEYLSSIKEYSKEEILVFVLQRPHRALWKNSLFENFSPNISSYFSFVQKEIKLNWDLVLKNSKILEKNIKNPVFLTFESSQTLMIKLVEFFKEKGNLKEIALSNEELAQKMLSNLYNMATNNISYSNFHKLIQQQELNKDLLKPETYEELTKLLEIYITRTLKEGVIDYPAALYIYNNSLLRDNLYLNSLKRYKKVIVTEFESQVPVITKLLDKFEEISLYENSCGPCGIHFPNGKKPDIFIEKFETVELENKEEREFLDKLNKNIFLGGNESLSSENIIINSTFQSKSQINEYLLKIIKKIGQDKTIVILSPVRNPSLEYLLADYCKKSELSFINIDKNERLLDNPHIYALSSMALIYFELGNIYINIDEIKQILVLLFGFNYFGASLLANKVKIDKNFMEMLLKNTKNIKNENIEKIKFWRDYFNNNFTNVHEFFVGLYESKDKFSEESFVGLKKLIDISKSFIENLSAFENIKDSNLEFFLSIRKGLKETESLEEIYNKIKFEGIILGTPSSYLTYSKETDVTVFIDIENNLWNMNFINIIQNPFILNAYFSKDYFYSFETDNQLKREELFNLLSRIYYLSKEKILFLGIENNGSSLLKDTLIR